MSFLDSLDTDTLVFLFTAAIFAPFIIWAVISYRADKREAPQRQAEEEARFAARAAELGLTPDQLRAQIRDMPTDQAVDYLMNSRERFLMSRGLLSGNIFGSFKPCRPGRRPFTNSGVRVKSALVLGTASAAYALAEVYDAVMYRELVFEDYYVGAGRSYTYLNTSTYENHVSGVLMAIAIALLLLGILSGVLFNDRHGWWLTHPHVMVGMGLCLPAGIGVFASLIPLRGLDEDYSVLKVGYSGTEVLGQYGWIVFAVMIALLVLVVPEVRGRYLAGRQATALERTRPTAGLAVAMACMCLLPAILVYVVVGGDSIVSILICAVCGIVAIYSLFNVFDLCDWAQAQQVDGVYEWDAALWICLLALFGVFSFGEAAEKGSRRASSSRH